MENAPLINLTFHNRAPGTDPDVFQRYLKWREEVYGPILNKIPEVKELDNTEIVRPTLEYPRYGSILHWDNLHARDGHYKSTESQAINDELRAWVKRGVRQTVWSVTYELIRSLRCGVPFSANLRDTTIDKAPIMSLEAFRLSPGRGRKVF